ncbi:MAG TPA: lamin tail domain-containing protein, partial [Vulgatibacter sp.]
QICTVTVGDLHCEIVDVDVVRPGDLAITEVQLDPSSGASGQWIEVRNLRSRAVSLEGFELSNGAGLHLVQPDQPLAIQPGAFATLAASATPGFAPDYVYGPGLPLDPTGGGVSLQLDGLVVAQVEWDPWWPLVSGASLELDGGRHVSDHAARPLVDPFDFCVAEVAYAGADLGTPGSLGPGCVSEYEIDFYSERPFIDVSQTGTPVPAANVPDAIFSIPGGLLFSFPFFGGTDRTELWVNSGGYVGFGKSCFIDCQLDFSKGLIYAFHDRLEAKPGASFDHALLTVGGTDVMILQWTGFRRSDSEGTLTFQVQLWEGGDVVIAYEALDGDETYLGSEALVGLTGVDWSGEVFYSVGSSNLRPGQALSFQYR